MVSLWPWKGEDNSAASFEKALSALSARISKSQIQLDSLRQRCRRYKALWTLYTSLAYMLCAIVLGLTVGFKNCNAYEYTALAGSPVVIYLGRTSITSYYNYRINLVSARLEESQNERLKTINKLKDATKYNTTQQLLEKYGQEPSSEAPTRSTTMKTVSRKDTSSVARTGIAPPPTANIPRQNTHAQPSSPDPRQSYPQTPQSSPRMSLTAQEPALEPEFAPNAFEGRQYSTSESTHEGKWYDRVFDLLLGEDETSPRNRIVLICKQCRLVNGQAPPGVKRLQDVGKWKCVACHATNGEEDEGRKIVAEIKEKMAQPDMTQKSGLAGTSKEVEEADSDMEDTTVTKTTRRKGKK